MKKLLVLTAVAALTATAFGQGVVQFQNRDTGVTPQVNAPIYLDVVGTGSVGALSGAGYRAALLGGPVGSTAFSVSAGGVVSGGAGMVMLASPTTGATWVTFRTGAASGFVAVGADAARTAVGVDWGQQGVFQVVAWEGSAATWAEAIASQKKIGASNPLTLTLPAGPTDPVYRALQGLTPFAIVAVPEPSSFALAGLGAAALLIFRRRK